MSWKRLKTQNVNKDFTLLADYPDRKDLQHDNPSAIRKEQETRLSAHLRYCYENSLWYRELFDDNDLSPDDFQVVAVGFSFYGHLTGSVIVYHVVASLKLEFAIA